jgi:hypothetical protein
MNWRSKMNRKLILRVAFFLVFFLLGMLIPAAGAQPVRAQQAAQTTCLITPIQEKAYPLVQVNFRVIDSLQYVVPNLNVAQVRVSENNKPVNAFSLTANQNGVGINLYFVIDQGNRTDQRVVKDTIKRFAEKFMLNGVDRVTIFTTSGQGLYLPATSSVPALQAAIDGLPNNGVVRDPLSIHRAIAAAISRIRGENPTCMRSSQMVVISGKDVVYTPGSSAIGAVANDARSLGMPVHVVRVPQSANPTVIQEDAGLKELASEANGIYEEAFFGGANEFTALDQDLFQKLSAQRFSYMVEFRSSDGSPGDHQVSVLTLGATANTPGSSARYSIKLQDPVVTITSPNSGLSIDRTSQVNTTRFDTDTIPVSFAVTWSDGLTRRITQAVLSITSPSGTVTQNATSTVPGESVPLSFNWDLRSLVQPGANAVTLKVQVTDELGRTGTSKEIGVVVNVIIIAPPPTAASPTEPAATAAPVVVSPIINQIDYTLPLLLLIGGAILAVIIVALIAIFTVRRFVAAAKAKEETPEPVENPTMLMGEQGGKMILASLEMVTGPYDLRDQKIPIYDELVSIGRSARCTIQLNLRGDSSVGREHCTLMKLDKGWAVSPLVSTHGETFLNGAHLKRGDLYPIKTSDTIQLGMTGYNHVVMVFTDEREVGAMETMLPEIASPGAGVKLGDVTPSAGIGKGAQAQDPARDRVRKAQILPKKE